MKQKYYLCSQLRKLPCSGEARDIITYWVWARRRRGCRPWAAPPTCCCSAPNCCSRCTSTCLQEITRVTKHHQLSSFVDVNDVRQRLLEARKIWHPEVSCYPCYSGQIIAPRIWGIYWYSDEPGWTGSVAADPNGVGKRLGRWWKVTKYIPLKFWCWY